MMTFDEVRVVRDLPQDPVQSATYSFARIPRSEVVYGTHGFHKYPAKFIPQFPRWALSYDCRDGQQVVLDPFCGSGTTLVEAGLGGHTAIGFDISPVSILISSAKVSSEAHEWDPDQLVSEVEAQVRSTGPRYVSDLRGWEGKSRLGLHYTWSNWFDAGNLGELLAIRDAIRGSDNSAEHINFALASLSAVVKSCSYLDEDQIKVRYDKKKAPMEPMRAFAESYLSTVARQRELSARYRQCGSQFDVRLASASELPLPSDSVDRIVTSPPYINAVDYSMAHKYNMFVLGMIEPNDFKKHCRDYIGMTERAVRAADLREEPVTAPEYSEIVSSLWDMGTPTSRNRAFVVSQYFDGMLRSFSEAYRVLRAGGLYFLVVGENNRICGSVIPTAEILVKLAQRAGFKVERHFYHQLANRSAMRLSRSSTGGVINREVVYVLRKV